METGLITNLYVFTGHIFHDSGEEIWRIFTSSDHLQRKHTPENTMRFSQDDIFQLSCIIWNRMCNFNCFLKIFLMLFHPFHLLCPAGIIYEDMDVKLQKGESDRLWIFNSWVCSLQLAPLWFYHLKLPLSHFRILTTVQF